MVDGDVLVRNNVSYLHNLAQKLPEDVPCKTLLKNYYLTKSYQTESKTRANLPSKLKDSKNKCSKCCLYRKDVGCEIVLKPASKSNRFTKRLLQKKRTDSALTTFQQTASKHLRNFYSNKVCKKNTVEVLRKPEPVKAISQKTAAKRKKQAKVAKKKKRKKDRFSGLNPEAVMAITPIRTQERILSKELDVKNERRNIEMLSKKRGKLNKLLSNVEDAPKQSGLGDFLQTVGS